MLRSAVSLFLFLSFPLVLFSLLFSFSFLNATTADWVDREATVQSLSDLLHDRTLFASLRLPTASIRQDRMIFPAG